MHRLRASTGAGFGGDILCLSRVAPGSSGASHFLGQGTRGGPRQNAPAPLHIVRALDAPPFGGQAFQQGSQSARLAFGIGE